MAWIQQSDYASNAALATLKTDLQAKYNALAGLPKVDNLPAIGPITTQFIYNGSLYVAFITYQQNINS